MEEDLLAILMQEHREALDLFHAVERAEVERRPAALRALREAIGAHMRSEQTVLYARLRSDPVARQVVLQSEQEHHVISTLLRELTRLRPHSSRFLPKLRVLMEIFRKHIDDEESELFHLARHILGDEVRELAAAYQDRRGSLAT